LILNLGWFGEEDCDQDGEDMQSKPSCSAAKSASARFLKFPTIGPRLLLGAVLQLLAINFSTWLTTTGHSGLGP
jgi:hypothetical protein